MKFQKIAIPHTILDINFKFYFFMKELNSSATRVTDTEIERYLEAYFINQIANVEQFKTILNNILESTVKSNEKKDALQGILLYITTDQDLACFIFALKLLQIKPLLLAEAKLAEFAALTQTKIMNQLSITYDTLSKSRPYYTRVHGALLALFFFEKIEKNDTQFIAKSTYLYIETLVKDYNTLKQQGLHANQMFMLMFTESINQSIKTDAGASYEERLFNVLINIGINPSDIKKTHDASDKSTEFDFYFILRGKSIGIGAKRTVRERYKQFIKTAQMSSLDLMICVTLGIDVTEQIAKNIRMYNVILFVADEIYNARPYLQDINGIYPASALNLPLLEKLTD